MLCAIVAVARKLAGILHRMWIEGRLRRQGDAEAETEAGAVIHGADDDELSTVGAAASPLKKEPKIPARAVSVPWWGRETANVRYLLPASVHRDESARLLGQPCL